MQITLQHEVYYNQWTMVVKCAAQRATNNRNEAIVQIERQLERNREYINIMMT